jgi:hypothetical protein
MSNFNPERIGIAIQANRFARVCLEESIKYASKRKTFNVLLRDHPVIRAKVIASLCFRTVNWRSLPFPFLSAREHVFQNRSYARLARV